MNILITGASKGIGKAVALEMAKENHSLAICARNESALLDLKAELHEISPAIKLYVAAVDCSNKIELQRFCDEAIKCLGEIDVLINNVGMFSPSAILEEDDEALELNFKTNVYPSYILYKKLAPSMIKKRKGYIFNICSIASIQTIVNAGSYCVTKTALLSLNNVMREETKPHGIKVTAILPGSTLTSSWDGVEVDRSKFVLPEEIATTINHIMKMVGSGNVDQLIITPQKGQG